jgi:hypothetical protein
MPTWNISKTGPPAETAEFVSHEIRQGVHESSTDVDGWEGSNAIGVAHAVESLVRIVGNNLQTRFRQLEADALQERVADAQKKADATGEPFEEPARAPSPPHVTVTCGGSITHEGIMIHDLRIFLNPDEQAGQ